MSTAREAILGRVRVALGERPAGAAAGAVAERPGATPSAPRPDDRDLRVRFLQRVSAYGASVRVTEEAGIAATLLALCEEHGASRLACPADLPLAWRPPELDLVPDSGDLTPAALDGVDGVLTGAALAAAETGTIALDHGRGQGRRVLTLLPDLHVCVLEATAIVPDVPELFDGLAAAVAEGRPITLISGPSATSDIELSRVEGVHGPRRLAIVLVAAEGAGAEAETNPQERDHGT